jgi:hypothetical protein
MEYSNCLCSLITNDARCTRENICRIAMVKISITRRRLVSPGTVGKFKEKINKMLHFDNRIV